MNSRRYQVICAVSFLLIGVGSMELRAQIATGIITGRVLNEDTGQYLRSAVVSIVGANISTLTESGGTYTLLGVPPGEARVVVSFAGLEPAETPVLVTYGGTTTRDFVLSSKSGPSGIVKLDKFHVVTEREGNFKAIQEQKAALEIKTVIATDAFGDVSEGNVGEFLKLMPGVMMDYVDADIRTVSIGGLDPKYAVIMMDGAPVASAGSSDIVTGRAFEFEQLSIASIETVELSKTPTPDVAGSALAGVVNLRSKGAFDRKGRQIRWSTSAQVNSHHLTFKRTSGPDDKKRLKFQPNASFEYSDVMLDGKLGILAGYNFARTFVEQNISNYTYVFDANAMNNAMEVPRMNTLQIVDAPKSTDRANHNLRIDYKVLPSLGAWVRIDYNTYGAESFQRNVLFNFNNAINGPAVSDPKSSGVDYSLKSQTTTLGTASIRAASAFDKHGSTTTFSTGLSFKRGAFRADAQGQMSRATSSYDDVKSGYFNAGLTDTISNLTLRWERNNAHDAAISVTQLAGRDWRDPASYNLTASPQTRLDFRSKDQQWTGKADFRYDIRSGPVPVTLKWGADVRQQIRDVSRIGNLALTYLGADGLPSSGDESWPIEPNYRLRNLAGGNLTGIFALDRFALGREFNAHPERFVMPTAQTLLMSKLRMHWDVKEQLDSLYNQTIFKITKHFEIAPGVRLENTRSSGRGPTDRGDDYAKTQLTGNPNANIPTTNLDYIQARYGSDATNVSDYHTWLKYIHLTYRPSQEAVFRASFNDSITRPNLDNLAGGVTINPDSNPPSARIPNPTLRPERGRNIFLGAEYYFPKGAGFFNLSVSRRDIADLIRTTVFDVPIGQDFIEGDGLELGGYRVTTSDNVGKAHISTAELSYRQNLVFLPGFWRRVSLFANYTALRFDNYENFRRPKRLANGGISFDHRGLSLRWNVVWTPMFRRAAVPVNGWAVMEGERLTHDAQLGFRVSPRLSLFMSARNIFNRPQINYFGPIGDYIVNRYHDYGAIWTLGARGQF